MFREFMEQAADLAVSYGGSLSGEHGDGQARAELLPRMYPPDIIDLFAGFKRIWDPENLLNPGALVDPRPLDADLRQAGPVRELPLALPYEQDGGSLARAVRRCVGVAACVDTATGVMCPSYMATGEERHSTRGRARLLAEMLRGEAVPDGWRSPEVREALDLCLGCKGCASDCPVHVDMATYRTEFLYQHYRRRPRPVAHYSMGWLPLWLRAVALAPAAANLIARSPAAGPLKRLGGIDPRRVVPVFPPETFTRWFRRRAAGPAPADARPVLLWPDTFSDHLQPSVLRSAVEVLEHLGFDVRLPSGPVCCGLTWYSTGQLGTARRVVRRSLRALADAGLPPTPRWSAWTRAAPPPCARTCRACSAPPRVRSPNGPAPSPSSSTSTPPGPRSPVVGRRRHPDSLPPARRPRHRRGPAGRGPDRAAEPGAGLRLLRAGRQLRLRAGPLRGVGGDRRARVAPGGPGRVAGHRDPGRRLQLPDPDLPTRRGPPRPAPRRADRPRPPRATDLIGGGRTAGTSAASPVAPVPSAPPAPPRTRIDRVAAFPSREPVPLNGCQKIPARFVEHAGTPGVGGCWWRR
ncbi:(Fe-S)-binding protein [Kitasatospora aburaviensis]